MANTPDHVEVAIVRLYKLDSLIKVLSLALDGEQISGMTFEKAGGGSLLDMAADMAGEIIEELEAGGA